MGMAGGMLSNQIFQPFFIERLIFRDYRLEQPPVYVTDKKEIFIQENTALKNAIEKVEKIIVGVETKTGTAKVLQGSGLILTSDGLIITLAELVPQGASFSFLIEGKKVAYQILKRDPKSNLALIKLESVNLPTAGFADLEKIKSGERVFLVGVNHPLVKAGAVGKTVNEGIIKNLGGELIETNILEKKSLAGSPLFDIKGDIVGLNTISETGQVSAIPVSKIRSFVGF